MGSDESPDWLVKLYEEQGTTLHRLVVLLGVEGQSGRIVRGSMLALHRRSNRLIDPQERIEFAQEHAVHLARAARPAAQPIVLPEVPEARQQEILKAISSLPPRMAELLIVSHYLSVFGPDLAAIMRMSVRGCNQKLEIALQTLRSRLQDPAPVSQPGALESLSQEITAALRSAARQVQAPGTGTLEGELAQLAGRYRRHLSPRAVVLLTVAAILLGLVLAVVTRPRPAPAVVQSPPVSEAPTVAASRTLPAQVRNIAVYYIGRSDGLLYRELRDLPSAENLLNSVVEATLTLVPLDPDYRSAWGPGQVLSVESAGDTVTVDLSEEAYSELIDPDVAVQARNQMVYSISALMGDDQTVVFFQEESDAPPAPFHSDTGFTASSTAVLAPIEITSPRNQAQLSVGEIKVSGVVKAGAPAPTVAVTDIDSGALVASKESELTGDSDSDGLKRWETSVSLGAGNYDIRATTVWGAASAQYSENKAVRVLN